METKKKIQFKNKINKFLKINIKYLFLIIITGLFLPGFYIPKNNNMDNITNQNKIIESDFIRLNGNYPPPPSPTPYAEPSNRLLYRNENGYRAIIYKAQNIPLSDGQYYPREINKFKKENWVSLGLELGSDDYKTEIYEVYPHPIDDSKFYLGTFDRQGDQDFWTSLYELDMDYDNIENSKLNLIISTRNQEIYGLGRIEKYSVDYNYALVEYNCRDCEPALYSNYSVVSLLEPQNYQFLGKATNFNFGADGTFNYQFVPQECIDIIKSYDDLDDSLKCTENAAKETFYGKI